MKTTKYLRLVGIAALLIAFCPLQTRADTIAFSVSSNTSIAFGDNTTLGYAFTVSSPISVTMLGLFDRDNDGLNASHDVTIWTSTGTQLVQATIPAGTGATLTDGFRYVSSAPFLLVPGTYTIGGFYAGDSDFSLDAAASITSASGLSYVGTRSAFGFTFPSGDAIGEVLNSYFGPNFQFITGVGVPTPDSGSTCALLLLAVAAVLGLHLLLHRPSAARSMLPFRGMKTLPKKLLPLTLFGIAVTSLFSVRPAQAYTVTLERVGFDTVVATGSGALDLTGLTLEADDAFGGPGINPFLGNIITGSSNHCELYQGAFTGPSSFGRGSQTSASNGTGDIVGMLFNGGDQFSALLVPQNYVSGTALSDSATYNNVTLVTLFVTPGTYVWTWGDGADQRFTLQIGSVGVPRVPDGGSTVSLLGCALLGLAALRRKLSCQARIR
jgi:hypothetical protein